MKLIGSYAFDTREEAESYRQTLATPDNYTVETDGICWGVIEVKVTVESETQHDEEGSEQAEEDAFTALLNALAF